MHARQRPIEHRAPKRRDYGGKRDGSLSGLRNQRPGRGRNHRLKYREVFRIEHDDSKMNAGRVTALDERLSPPMRSLMDDRQRYVAGYPGSRTAKLTGNGLVGQVVPP